jgi:hypothetical protein
VICHKYKTIFTHIPKTGGTSVESMFGVVKIKNQNYFKEELNKEKHWTIQDYSNEYSGQFDLYYKWTIVRNPWEKELSAYNMAKNQVRFRHLSFKDFLREVSIPQAVAGTAILFKNQTEYFMTNENVSVDQIIRHENLEASWKNICLAIGKDYEELPFLRHLTKKPLSEYYDQECIDLVAQLRKQDIEFLNYDMPRI